MEVAAAVGAVAMVVAVTTGVETKEVAVGVTKAAAVVTGVTREAVATGATKEVETMTAVMVSSVPICYNVKFQYFILFHVY